MRTFIIKKLLDVQQGVNQETGREWKSRDVVLEADDNVIYPDTLVASLKNDSIGKFRFGEGERVNVLLGFMAHEHNDRWYNNIIIRDWETNNH